MDENIFEFSEREIAEAKKLSEYLKSKLNPKTRIVVVPRGTTVWTVQEMSEDGDKVDILTNVEIKLVPLFGVMVGYDEEHDIYVTWPIPKRGDDLIEAYMARKKGNSDA